MLWLVWDDNLLNRGLTLKSSLEKKPRGRNEVKGGRHYINSEITNFIAP